MHEVPYKYYPNLIYRAYKPIQVSNDEADQKTDLKKRIAEAAGVNPKTVERGAKNLIWLMFGVSEKDLESDPALRAYVRYKTFGENPSPYVVLDDEEEKKD